MQNDQECLVGVEPKLNPGRGFNDVASSAGGKRAMLSHMTPCIENPFVQHLVQQ